MPGKSLAEENRRSKPFGPKSDLNYGNAAL